MTWEWFITIIKFSRLIFIFFYLGWVLPKKERKRCSPGIENQDIDVVQSVVRKHRRSLTDLIRGVWSIHQHEDQSCLDIVISALSKAEFMNCACRSALSRREDKFPGLLHIIRLTSPPSANWFVMWPTTQLTCQAHCCQFQTTMC